MGRPARRAIAGDSGGGGEGFAVGARVEVRSDDDGFRGAWYEATVAALRRRRRRHLRYVVAYSTLVSDADPAAPLAEAVAPALVRPSPPSASAAFELHQLVEAFHNDGWWAGVVSAARNPSSGRYAVSFPNSRELIEFPPSEIRPRLEWLRGEWVPAQHLQGGVPMFNAREKVEVIRYLDNLSFAWFPATVVKVIGTANFIVEYENLKAHGEEELLTEILDVQYIRPVPYISPESKNFSLSADVEAFCNGGWSAGVVSKVLSGSKYVVKMTRHDIDVEMEFDCTQLRFRREWNGKQWIEHSSKGKNGKSTSVRGMPSKRGKQPRATRRSRLPTAPRTSNIDVSKITHESHLTNTEIKRKKAGKRCNGSDVELGYSKKKLKKGNLERYKLRPRNCLSSSGDSKTISNLEEKTHCAMQTLEYFPSERNHWELLPASPQTPISNISMESKLEKMNGINKSLITRKSSSKTQRCKGSANQSKVSDIIQASTDHEAQLSLPIAAWRVKAKRKINFPSPEKRKKTPNAIKAGSRRSALEKNMNHILRSKESGDPKHSGEEAHDDLVVEKRCRIEDVGASKKDSEAHDVGIKVQFTQQVDDSEEGCTTPQEEYLCEGNQLILSPTPLQLSYCLPRLSGTTVENTLTFDAHAQNAGDEVPEGALLSFSKDSVEEVCGGPDNLPSARMLVANDRDASTCETPPENILVPFVKRSSIWESVETLEVFRRMPQQPHFLSLDQYSSEFREGMAIGLMVSFANLVASMSKLSCCDSLALFEEKLKSLGPLEANGFDVRFLRSRLKELIRVKNVQMECERRKAALQEKITEKGHDNNQLDGLIGALDGVITEVERNLMLFREKRGSLMTQRESNSLEISRLRMDACEAEEALLGAQQHFDRALVEPW